MHPIYDVLKRVFFVFPPFFAPVQFFIDAPFGRFSPPSRSVLLLDGITSWIIMELVSPIGFVNALVNAPLASSSSSIAPLTPASHILAALFLIHYANRALISPLRTPSRSKAHVIVTLSGVAFNLVNGTLMGTYLRSPAAAAFLTPTAHTHPAFWTGITLWAAGLVGNILHDEVLLSIRRNARAKGKAKATDPQTKSPQREHYGIPHGYLYAYVSYPNYLCEWVEWFGFALAAAPVPDTTSVSALVASVQPPWIFFLSEICLMIGRAYNGHQWYLRNLADYPKDRRVVIPFFF